MQVQLKTILNQVQHLVGFIYQEIELLGKKGEPLSIKVQIAEHAGQLARCWKCLKPAPRYDRLETRCWLHKPLWEIPVYFYYAPRRVQCAEHGVVVEHMPWNVGKRPYTRAMMCFLSQWARRLSWLETARCFGTSWEAVYRSVQWFVQWGLEHRQLEGITAIGIDEVHWLRPEKLLELIVWQRRKDQTVRPIARSLRGWSGEATNRSVLPDNVPTLARVAPEPRGDGVSASITRRGARLGGIGQNIQTLVSVVISREPNMLRGSFCSEHGGSSVRRHG